MKLILNGALYFLAAVGCVALATNWLAWTVHIPTSVVVKPNAPCLTRI